MLTIRRLFLTGKRMPDVLPFVIPGHSPGSVRRRWGIAAGVAIFFVVYAPAFFDDWRDREWLTLFAKSGQRLLAGETLYRHEDRDMYAYLPGLSVLTLPLAVLPAPLSVAVWYVVAGGCTVTAVWAAWRLTAGRGVDVKGGWAVVLGLTLVLAGRFLLSPLENHQFDAVIAALVLGGLVAWSGGRDFSGGLLLGLGAGLKGTPLLFAPYLLWRGQWKCGLTMLAACALLNLAPDLIGPRASGRSHLQDCYQNIVVPTRGRPPGVWLTGATMQHLNQSLGATVHRLTTFGFVVSRVERTLDPDASRARQVQMLITGLSIALLAVTLWTGGRPGGGDALRTTGPGRQRFGMESGMVACLMLLLSPQSSKAHFAILVLPVMQLVRAAVMERSRVAQISVCLLAGLGPLTVKGLVGSEMGDQLLLWGAPAFFTLATLITLWSLRLWQSSEREAVPWLPQPSPSRLAA